MNDAVAILGFVGIAWLITFVAVLLLSLPAFFSRDAFRVHRRFPDADQEQEEYRPDPWTVRRIVLIIVIAPFAICFLVLFGLPIIFGLAFVATCRSYRYWRYVTYRALRRQHRALAFFSSYFAGFRALLRSLFPPQHATPK